MNIPVFEHTLASIRSLIHNEDEPLQRISKMIKCDPGLFFSFLKFINSSGKRDDVTTLSQAISLIGAEGSEGLILQQDSFLNEDFLILWSYAIMAGEAAVLINERANIAEEEEAFFAGVLPSIGMLFMAGRKGYQRIVELLLKVPLEHRIYIEQGIYQTDLIEQLDMNMASPKTFKDVIYLMSAVFTKDGHRMNHLEHPAKYSMAYKSFELFRLIDTADTAARTLLFPSVVEAQEKFRELSKMHFKVPESETEELLANILERFEETCKAFDVVKLSERIILSAEDYHFPGISFLTKSESLKKALEEIYAMHREDKNILIYGESSVGKRLLAIALHRLSDNPRRTKPFLSIHCGTLDSETLEIELFGAKGGFLGLEKHKGSLELANGGTILLKDIDKIPLILQDRFAEILNKDEFYKIGETRPASFDIKFVITSKKDLVEEEREGRFSSRLLKVLNPVSLYLPPLRERREDIEFIADSIIEKYDLKLTDPALRLGLREYYETQALTDNLRDLKRLLFFLSAKHSLKT